MTNCSDIFICGYPHFKFTWSCKITVKYNYFVCRYTQNIMFKDLPIRARCTTLCYKVCQWLETGRWFSPGTQVSSTDKTDRHDITEMLLKMALNTIKQTKN